LQFSLHLSFAINSNAPFVFCNCFCSVYSSSFILAGRLAAKYLMPVFFPLAEVKACADAKVAAQHKAQIDAIIASVAADAKDKEDTEKKAKEVADAKAKEAAKVKEDAEKKAKEVAAAKAGRSEEKI
jgi:hypothetical protein